MTMSRHAPAEAGAAQGALAGEARPLQGALLGDVRHLGACLDPVHLGVREQSSPRREKSFMVRGPGGRRRGPGSHVRLAQAGFVGLEAVRARMWRAGGEEEEMRAGWLRGVLGAVDMEQIVRTSVAPVRADHPGDDRTPCPGIPWAGGSARCWACRSGRLRRWGACRGSTSSSCGHVACCLASPWRISPSCDLFGAFVSLGSARGRPHQRGRPTKAGYPARAGPRGRYRRLLGEVGRIPECAGQGGERGPREVDLCRSPQRTGCAEAHTEP